MKNPFIKILFLIVLSANLIACSKDDDSSSETMNDNNTNEEVVTDTNNTDSGNESGYSQIVLDIHRLVNEHRASINLNALELNAVASELSVEHCDYMISISDINHDGFNDRFKVLREREGAISAGENVAKFQRSAEEVMDAWLNSPGHRRNIEGDFTHIGIAAVKDANGRYYFTQYFYKS